MKTLFILDPLEKLNIEWDTSVYFVTEMCRRGHETWICDTPDIALKDGCVTASTTQILWDGVPQEKNKFTGIKFTQHFKKGETQTFDLTSFNVILNRKEPPMNEEYHRVLDLLDRVSGQVRVLNNPKGVRETNEKLSILEFPDFIAETIVTESWDEILNFQKKLRSDLVIKPLDNKGGAGIYKFKQGEAPKSPLTKPMMVQKYLAGGPQGQDKRIFLLNGRLLVASERHPRAGEFRTNLGLGGIYHKTTLTPRESEIVAGLGPFLRSRGLQFVGIDVMSEKLLEINVTCPGGLCETTSLYPELVPAETWANDLERHPSFAGK